MSSCVPAMCPYERIRYLKYFQGSRRKEAWCRASFGDSVISQSRRSLRISQASEVSMAQSGVLALPMQRLVVVAGLDVIKCQPGSELPMTRQPHGALRAM